MEVFPAVWRARMIISRASSIITPGSLSAAAKKTALGMARISLSRIATTEAEWAARAIIAISPAGSPGRITPRNRGSWPSSWRMAARRPVRTK